ncbi:hypothetical protein NEOC95_002227 [Neochlamydia sp. AcF95]|nr:hypothetical protein [Neochlamydia sp. AcF95]
MTLEIKFLAKLTLTYNDFLVVLTFFSLLCHKLKEAKFHILYVKAFKNMNFLKGISCKKLAVY